MPDAFIRGYLRTYARAVEQDEEEIIALYSQAKGTTLVSNHYVPSADAPPVRGSIMGNKLIWFAFIGALIVIVIMVYGWLVYINSSADENGETNNIIPATESGVAVETEPSQPDLSAAEIDVSTDAQEINKQQSDIEEKTVAIPSGFIDSPVLTDAELEFSFIDDCWVQVTDSNNEVLAVGLKAAGRRFIVKGVPPIQIVLGKPRAVNIQFNNESIDLSIYPASQTARFSLGEAILEQ